MRRDALLVTVVRGKLKKEIWRNQVLNSLPAEDRESAEALELAIGYWIAAAALDLEAQSRNFFAHDVPTSRSLYWSRLCDLCRYGPFCRLDQVTWDSEVDTRLSTGQIFRKTDPKLFSFYQRFDRQGPAWEHWPTLRFDVMTDDFLDRCDADDTSLLERASIVAVRASQLKAWSLIAQESGKYAYYRTIKRKLLRPADLVWTSSGERAGGRFVEGDKGWKSLIGANGEVFNQIVTLIPLW